MAVFGTRPEAIKMAPLVRALGQSTLLRPVVVVTAQHRAMLDQVLELFEIVPQLDLDLMQERQSLARITARALDALSPAIDRLRPDVVVVQGDTTSAMAAALAAFYHRVPVAHLEAGLRSGQRYAPFPEELNRRLVAQLSTLHLAPTRTASDNLISEGVSPSAIAVTGNTVIDALLWARARPCAYGSDRLEAIDRQGGPLLLVTAHRRESWGPRLASVGRALAELATREPDLAIVVPVHANPVVRDDLLPALGTHANVVVAEPLAYGAFVRLLARARLVLTDSGGLQEEGPALGKPVLVMRDTTERPEGVAAGTARLVGTDQAVIVEAVLTLLHDPSAYRRMATVANPYGDGAGAHRAVAALAHLLGLGPRPVDFSPGGPAPERVDRVV